MLFTAGFREKRTGAADVDIVILKDSEQIAACGAALIRRLLRDKPEAVLGLATGATPRALYRRLIADYQDAMLSFRGVTTFNLDEYIGIHPDDPQSYRSYMRQELFEHVSIFLDDAAASCLALRDYYDWVQEQKENLLNAKGGMP